MSAFFLLNLYQNDIRSDFNYFIPWNKNLKFPGHTAKPFSGPGYYQGPDSPVALVKLQIPDIPKAFAVCDVDDFLPCQIAKTNIFFPSVSLKKYMRSVCPACMSHIKTE